MVMIAVFSTILPVVNINRSNDDQSITYEEIQMADSIGYLSFADKAIKMNTAAEAEPIAQEIEKYNGLVTLELKGNTVGVEAGARLASALGKQKNIKRCLWSDMFTGRLKTEIPPILRSMCSAMMQSGCAITELDLSDNAFGPIGAEGISDFLRSSACYSLETLKLNNNGLGAGGKIVAACLLECHTNASREGRKFKLKTFVAGRNRLENPGAAAISEAFLKIGTLEEISIPQNGIKSEGIQALAKAVKMNKNLRVLNFNDNTCTAAGAIALSAAITDLYSLEVLNLGDCLCRDAGVAAIISVICDGRHNQLKLIDFSGSELTGRGGQHAIRSFSSCFNHTDTQLVIGTNCFGSFFDELRKLAAGSANVRIGDEDDDEGSLSERESSGDESDDEFEESETSANRISAKNNGVPPPNIESPLSNMDNLVASLNTVSVNANVQEKVLTSRSHSSDPVHPIISFLDRQLKFDTAQDAEEVARQIENAKEMVTLELRGNTLGMAAGDRIALAISTHPELKRCLWSDLFTGRLKTEIPPILRSLCSAVMRANCHITELDLSDNAFGPVGAEGIQEFLVSPAAYSLEVLKLMNNGLGAGGQVIATCLAKCYENSVRDGRPLRLKTFIAGRNRLEDPGAIALSAAFRSIGSLEELIVIQNGIRARGIQALADCFTYNKNLRVININDNTATEIGAHAIANALPHLKDIEILNLGDCLCRDSGCHAIVDSLSPTIHVNLKEVDLSGSELTGEAAIRISRKWRRFRENNARLNISSNCFGELFDDVAQVVQGSTVDIGDEEDDQGSLEDDAEEKFSDSDDGDQSMDDDNELPLLENEFVQKINGLKMNIAETREQFLTATQESASRLLLELGLIIEESQNNEDVLSEAVATAGEMMAIVESIKKRPISTSTQVLNNIIAQIGCSSVKPEIDWGIKPSRDSVSCLIKRLSQQGHFPSKENKETISYFFS